MKILQLAAACLILASAIGGARASVPGGTPTFTDPLDITNTYHPFQPGGVKIFRGKDGDSRSVGVHLYLSETRTFSWNSTTVECRVLREIAFENGELLEISDNYFAQADDGTVYYFGEVVDNYENGVVVDNDGSWLVGGPTLPSDPPTTGNDDQPTVFMPANPEVGDVFKPEHLPGIVDETGEILRVNVTVKLPAGRYEGTIKIQETSALAPGTTNKWYAPGVGVVMEKAKREHLNLISSTLVSP
ncbi:MAG: hypothetical protein ACREQP_19815 [Candidatus Binatia bacterium]